MIGLLLFAALRELRRKNTGAEASPHPSEAESVADAAAAPSGGFAYGGANLEDETPASFEAAEETPEWEPHAAARATEDDGLPDATPEDDGLPDALEPETASLPSVADERWTEPVAAETSDEAPDAETDWETTETSEEKWAEPTPTAMTDAAAFDEVDDVSDVTAPADEPEPVATAADESPVFTSGTPDESTADLPAGMPEEEPFEHAGRWWFKRGEEVLLYNEQSGEWVPSTAPVPAATAAEPAPFESEVEAARTIGDISSATEEPEDAPAETEEPRPVAQGGFWRCPACGAVNGSTATTCRMCFAARPAD